MEKRCVREWVEVFGFPCIKLLVSRSSHTFLFAALLQCLLPVTTPLVAMSVAYLGTFFVATTCCSSHSTTCRQWTCMSAAAAVAIECGTPWAVCASLFLQICPTWFLWWPPKKALDLPTHGNVVEISDGTRWRVYAHFHGRKAYQGPKRTSREEALSELNNLRQAIDEDDWFRIGKFLNAEATAKSQIQEDLLQVEWDCAKPPITPVKKRRLEEPCSSKSTSSVRH